MLRIISLLLVTFTVVDADEPQFLEPVDQTMTAEADGSEQRYVVLAPAKHTGDQPVDVMIALHGHGSDRWQFVRDGRPECLESRRCAAAAGMLFVSPDYRARTSWMSPLAEQDLLQLIGILKREYRVRHVVLCGGSMGGTAALAFAALHPDQIDAVVSLNGTANLVEYDKFQDAIAAAYGGTKEEVPDVYRSRSAELHTDRLLRMPVAATTGGKDTLVPADSVLRLMQRLQKDGGRTLLLHREDGGHSTNAADTHAAITFVLRQLAETAAEPSR